MNKRKQRQLSYLLKKLKVSSNNEQLISKAKSLFEEIKYSLSGKVLKRAMTILGLGIVSSSFAQVNFAPPVDNPFSIDSTNTVSAPTFADLDGDGDMDMLTGEYYGAFVYQENIGTVTAPNFGTQQSNPFGLTTPSSTDASFPDLVDYDDDGDFDLVAGVAYGNFLFYENIGTSAVPNFAPASTNPFGLIASYHWSMPTFVDIDSDGDMDIYVGEYYGNIQYYENIGTPSVPDYAAPIAVPLGLNNELANVSFADFDYDGDLDMFAIEYYGAMAYFENTGNASAPIWGTKQVNPFSFNPNQSTYYGISTVVDLDSDGDMDIVLGETEYGSYTYYENNDPSVGIQGHKVQASVYPNPVSNQFSIQVENTVLIKASIYDNSGKQLMIWDKSYTTYDISHLSRGMYTLKMEFEDGTSVQSIVKD